MKNIIFATVNSFVGLPPVKQLFQYYQKSSAVYSIQCTLDDYEDFFSEIENNQDVVYRFRNAEEYKNQFIIKKIGKYIKTSYFISKKLISFRSKQINIFTTDIFTLAINLVLKNKYHKLVYLQYEIVEENRLNPLDQVLFKLVKNHSQKIDVLITPELNRTKYLQKMLPNSKTESFLTIPNTNNNKIDIVPKSKVKKDRSIVISHIGAVGLNHHIANFLRAISQLDQELYEVRFIGSLTEEVIELIKQYKIHCVKIVGQLKHSKLHKYYLETDIGIILYKDVSLNHRFCAPNKLYEYWSYGIPVIGDNLPGLKSVFTNDCLGEIIEMRDFNNIRDTIENLKCNVEEKKITQKYFMDNLKLDNYLSQLDEKLLES